MAVTTTNLGVITAYGDAVAAGYTGTKAEWQALMASYATVAEEANDAKDDAVAAKNTAVAKATEATTAAATANAAKDTATSKATEATTAAGTATTKASEASASAQSIAQSAAQIQENTDSIDQLMSDLTATNAELADVRVGADGTTYNSAGAAVRGQISDLKNNLTQVDDAVSLMQGEIWKLTGSGLPVSDNGVISIMSSSSWNLYGAIATPNTEYTIYRHSATFSTLNRVFVMFLSKVIYAKADFDNSLVLGSPTIETNATQGLVKNVLTAPVGTKMILICITNSSMFSYDGRDPVPTIIYKDGNGVKHIVPNVRDRLNFSDIAKNPNATAQNDGSLLFDATSAQIDTYLPNIYPTNNLEENNIFCFEVRTEGSTDSTSPNVIFMFDKLFQSIPYCFNSEDGYEKHIFRFPFFANFEYIKMHLIVPVGTKLYIKSVEHHHNDHRRPYATGARLSAHLGTVTLAPENSAIGFKIAARLGYPSAICNPKVTSDGVLICYHDPKINTTARNADGTAISGDVYIASNTFETLDQYDYGIYLDPMYKGTKLLKLEEFFKICAVYGIMPVFSIHQTTNPLTATKWADIKTMLQKYGLTESLLVKCGNMDGLEVAYTTMGDSVWGYVYDIGGADVSTAISAFDASPVHQSTKRKYIGVTVSKATDENIASIISAGYMCEVYDIYANTSAKYKHWMSQGVCEFVDDQNPSYGYYW